MNNSVPAPIPKSSSANPVTVDPLASHVMQNTIIDADMTIPTGYQYIVVEHLEILTGVQVTVNGDIAIL